MGMMDMARQQTTESVHDFLTLFYLFDLYLERKTIVFFLPAVLHFQNFFLIKI